MLTLVAAFFIMQSSLASSSEAGQVTATVSALNCGGLDVLSSPVDYRLKDSTDALRWGIADVNRNHYDPAVNRIRHGEISTRVLDDLNFLLVHWPNHYPGLQALIEFHSRGGSTEKYRPIECYFELARRFVTNDTDVLILYGIYRYRSNDADHAESLWRQALQIAPDAADAHYNLGLLYFDRRNYAESLKHALHAYGAGYPLPGLKEKLQRVGSWKEAEATTDE